MPIKAITNASDLLTGQGIRQKDGRHPEEADLGSIPNGALVYRYQEKDGVEIPGEILWVGPTSELSTKCEHQIDETHDLENKQCLLPGLIDCHTHLIFDGDRSNEFARRCAGATYQEIAQEGGGILSTIGPTREASRERLLELAETRLHESLQYGVRAIEIKSGYGLTTEAEIKSLEVIQKLKKEFEQIPIQSTFLGAHAFPPDYSRQEYLDLIINEMLPQVAEKKLADACDVFIDEGYYSIQEGQKILQHAKDLGLDIKLHGDELKDTGSAELACDLEALSVDHLLQVNPTGIRRLAESQTVAVLLPGTAFYLKAPYAPARALIDQGASVAISTDFNPGSSMVNSLPTIMTLAALYMQMSRAEVFAAVTYNAAKALGWQERLGSLEPGRQACYTTLPFKKFEESYYQFSWAPGINRN